MKNHNHVAIAAVVVLHQAVGFAWYSMALFGSPWVHAMGKQASDMQPTPAPFIVSIVASVAMCYVVSWLLRALKVTTFRSGVGLGALLWLGIGAPAQAMHDAFEGMAWQVITIDVLHTLALAALTGGILAAWRGRTGDVVPR